VSLSNDVDNDGIATRGVAGALLRFPPYFPSHAGNVNSRETSASPSAARGGEVVSQTCQVHQVPPPPPPPSNKWQQFPSIRKRCMARVWIVGGPDAIYCRLTDGVNEIILGLHLWAAVACTGTLIPRTYHVTRDTYVDRCFSEI